MIVINFKTNTIEDIEKAYTEGIYSDTPANKKLGRVGMSYTAWEGLKRKSEENKINEGIKSGDSQYASLSPLEKELSELDNHHTKTIYLQNGDKLLCRYDSYHQKYIALATSTNTNGVKIIQAKIKKDFKMNLNKYIYEKNTKIGKTVVKIKPSFTKPTDRQISEPEQEKIDNYWYTNRSNPVLSNILRGDGVCSFKEGLGDRFKPPMQNFIDDNLRYASDAPEYFNNKDRYYRDFEDISLKDFNKYVKKAIPTSASQSEKKKMEETLFWGNILRASGDDNLELNALDIANKFLDPTAVGPKYEASINKNLVIEDGNITGIKVSYDILSRKDFTYKSMLEKPLTFKITGDSIQKLQENYFKVVGGLLRKSQIEYDTKPDTLMYSAMSNNNIFKKGDKYFYQGWTESQIGKTKKKEE